MERMGCNPFCKKRAVYFKNVTCKRGFTQSNKKGYHYYFLQQVINQTLTTAGKQQQQQPAQQQVQLAVPATQAQTLQLAAAQGTHAQTVQLAAPTVTIGATGQLQVKVHLHWGNADTKPKMFITVHNSSCGNTPPPPWPIPPPPGPPGHTALPPTGRWEKRCRFLSV